MGRFYPLYVRRSDGKTETLTNHKRKEGNQPTPEQLDTKPDANGTCDYYREVPIDEPKHLDWRRKLGGMLARELGWTDAAGDKGYMLVAFPENYRLFEHVKTVKKTEADGKVVQKSKTHAGGGNDRQDAYLYGHPMGRKKRYRSPADFFHHLLWLVTDEAGDSDNCACKICCPEELEEKSASALAPATRDVKPEAIREQLVKQETRPAAAAPARQPVVELTRRTSGQTGPQTNPPASTTATKPTAQQPTNARPTSLPHPKRVDQALDLRFGHLPFRQGEMVWFNRGSAWGLGVIIQRWRLANDQPVNYQVQPLSWPGSYPDAVTITKDTDLRPWLAWSVPGYTCARLNDAHLTFDTADWSAIQRGDYGQGEIGVDGSILAAKAIDATYTTFSLDSRTEPQPGTIETRWTGMYLGAERIWLGDTVRVRSSTGIDVLVIREILERASSSAFNNAKWSTIQLIGDVYTLQEARYNNLRNPVIPNTELPGIPQRMLEDVRRRNPYTMSGRGTASYWKPVRNAAVYELKDVRGRWYEASVLLPILQGKQDYDNKAKQGIIQEAGLMMNGRHDCNVNAPGGGVPDNRKPERRDALGRSVPESVRIVDGNEPYQPAGVAAKRSQPTIDPAFGANGGQRRSEAQARVSQQQTVPQQQRQQNTQHQYQQQQQQLSQPTSAPGNTETQNAGSGFEEFMDLDGMGAESMPGYDGSFAGRNYYG